MKNNYQISEYDSFVCEKQIPGYHTLPKKTFEQLEEFILTNNNKDTDAIELMGISARKGIGKIITAKNYVGTIAMSDGRTIEILPKLYPASDVKDVKKLLIEMLKTLNDTPFKSFNKTNVDIEKLSVFEIFIAMFISEISMIVKHGLKSDYELVEENENKIKGKILFNKNIRYNYAHKEKNYIQYEEYNNNRPENKLIKSTLYYLYKKTNSLKNKTSLKVLLNSFKDVDYSSNYKDDFSKFNKDRNMKDYEIVLTWCMVFLMNKSFTSFVGSQVSIALLFPMEKLFEDYIAFRLRKQLDRNTYVVSTQDRKYYLFDEPTKKFAMRPDIVVTNKVNGNIYVLDTKWKVLDERKNNYGISQNDMYQMYAYQKKYNSDNVTLIYPMTDSVTNNNISFTSQDGVNVRVKFVNLLNKTNLDNDLKNIIQ
ncbi:MAG: McrC family protein [Thomasclavelia sp.]|nr:McrC family protein [Thomasclavelia sp.]